jgi:rare lipoprotein A
VNARIRPLGLASLLGAAIACAGLAQATSSPDGDVPTRNSASPKREVPVARPVLDRSAKKRVGTASVYAHRFVGRKMADGTRMAADDDNAASKTLPLGTTAKVTNLKTGQSATVTIQDRGPYVKGRIVDLSPATAEQLGITRREGVAKVEVQPITVPPPEAQAKNRAATTSQ